MKRIAFITDIHLEEQFPIDHQVDTQKNFETVLADLKSRGINEVVFGGDIGGGTALGYFFEKLQPFSTNIVLGNHDQFDEVKDHFVKSVGEKALFYKSEDENYQYFYLDTSLNELSADQLDWLQNELIDKKELILFIHHPILEIDTPADRLYPLKNREQLQAALLNFKNNVTLFCGHYHMNDKQEFKNITQYTTQSMAFQMVKNATELLIDNSQFGYRIIEISPDNIETQLINFETSILPQ